MKKLYEFTLSKGGGFIGGIRWHYDSDVEGNCRLDGDAKALATLRASMEQAVAEGWKGRYPRPGFVVVEEPLCSLKEMITVLQLGGYDMPEVFAPYTPEAQLAESTKHAGSNRRY